MQIHANCRIRRIYFSDKLYSEKDLPKEFRLFVPVSPQSFSYLSFLRIKIKFLVTEVGVTEERKIV